MELASRDFCEGALAAGGYRETERRDVVNVRGRNWRGAATKAIRLVLRDPAGKMNSVVFCLFSFEPRRAFLCSVPGSLRSGILVSSFTRELLEV